MEVSLLKHGGFNSFDRFPLKKWQQAAVVVSAIAVVCLAKLLYSIFFKETPENSKDKKAPSIFFQTTSPSTDFYSNFAEFQQRRRLDYTLKDLIDTYQFFKQVQDTRFRQDVQPKSKEIIPNYLSRIFHTYQAPEGVPRGFVFATFDFMWKPDSYGPNKHPALFFLEKHIGDLQKLGIKKIYLEQLRAYSINDQEDSIPFLLHHYFHDQQKEIPPLSTTMKEICDLAKKHHIEVIGTEIYDKSQYCFFSTAGISNGQRLRSFNPLVARWIRTINEPFVILQGQRMGN